MKLKDALKRKLHFSQSCKDTEPLFSDATEMAMAMAMAMVTGFGDNDIHYFYS